MVLVVVAVLVWNFSTRFQQRERVGTFSEFMSAVKGDSVARVVISGQDLTYATKGGENFRTYAPSQYDGLANALIEKGVVVQAREATASPWASLLFTWGPMLLVLG